MANFKKLIKKSSEDEKDVSSETSETNNISTEVVEDILPDLDDSDDIVIGDDENNDTTSNEDKKEDEDENNDSESSKNLKPIKSVKKTVNKKTVPKKTLIKKKTSVNTKKKEQVKISDITKSWAMDSLLINFLEHKGIDWLKGVLRKHILDQFSSEEEVIWKENERILSLFEKNLKNNWDIVKWIHSIIARYEKLKSTDFNNWILPEDEVDIIKEENLSKIVQSISIIIWQYRNSLERELVMLDELDYFSNEDWYENTGLHMEVPTVKEKQKEKLIQKTSLIDTTSVIDESDSLDPLREKELIDEMEKFLSDDTDTNKEEKLEKSNELIISEEKDDEIEVKKDEETTIDLDIDNDWTVDATIEVPKNIDIEDSELDIELPDTDETDSKSEDEDNKNKEKDDKSEELDMNFLDDLDIDDKKEGITPTETKSWTEQFDVDEFLKTLDSFGWKQDTEKKQDNISTTQEWDDDNDEIIIKV